MSGQDKRRTYRLVSRTDRTDLDVGEDDGRIGALALDRGGVAGGRRAGAAGDTRLGRVLVEGVVGVEPEHLGLVVVPEGHDEDHTGVEGIAHLRETTEVLERVRVAERGLLRVAERVGDGVVLAHARDVRLRVRDHLPVLHVQPPDLGERARRAVVRRVELRDDGELGRRVDGLAEPQERLVAHPPRVEVAAVLVADAAVAVVTVAAGGARAARLALDVADVRRHGLAVRVRLPDIHLVTAGAVLARARIHVVAGRRPVEDVGLYIRVTARQLKPKETQPEVVRTSPLMNLMSCGHWVSQ